MMTEKSEPCSPPPRMASGEHVRSTIAEESYVYVFWAGDINFAARRGEDGCGFTEELLKTKRQNRFHYREEREIRKPIRWRRNIHDNQQATLL